MDLDALHRNVSSLMKFKERFENMAGIGGAAVGADVVQELKADLAGVRDQLNALDGYKTQIVEPALKDISDILPKLAEVGDMLTWFQQNKENLEGAIAVADEFDGDEVQTDPPTTGAEPAPAAPESPTGEVSADPAPADPSAAPNS